MELLARLANTWRVSKGLQTSIETGDGHFNFPFKFKFISKSISENMQHHPVLSFRCQKILSNHRNVIIVWQRIKNFLNARVSSKYRISLQYLLESFGRDQTIINFSEQDWRVS